tara:strand:- start:13959 stop:14300 length:342 start_codon:yes stop_codon:yes gene_type:complete
MRIKNLIKAFSNINQIAEGVKNNIFKKEHVEEVAKERWEHCKKCEYLDNEGSKCVAPGTQPCCAECGCSLAFKLRALSSDCPKEKWKSLMSEEMEDKLKEKINYGEEDHNRDI